MQVKLEKVRLSFPFLFTPKPATEPGALPRFSAAFAIVPGSENAKKLTAAVDAVAKAKWADKATGILTELKAKGRVGYQERPLSKDGEVYEGFEDMYSLNASSKTRPTIVDRDRTPLSADSGKPYGGCYVNLIVDCWAQDNAFGKRINFDLAGVQFESDGEAFSGGRPASVDDFEALAPVDAPDFV